MTGGKEQDESPGQPQEGPSTTFLLPGENYGQSGVSKNNSPRLHQCFLLPACFLCSVILPNQENKITTPGGRFREGKVQTIREECINPCTHFSCYSALHDSVQLMKSCLPSAPAVLLNCPGGPPLRLQPLRLQPLSLSWLQLWHSSFAAWITKEARFFLTQTFRLALVIRLKRIRYQVTSVHCLLFAYSGINLPSLTKPGDKCHREVPVPSLTPVCS